jgi:RNA polymerase sigma factor (sigma-70 family)
METPANVQRSMAERLKNGDVTVLKDMLVSFGPWTEWMLAQKYPCLKPFLEDVVEEALYRVWASRDKYNVERGSLQTWFYKIADNFAKDELRSPRYKARALEAAGDLSQVVQSDPHPGEDGGAPPPLSPDHALLLQILSALPEADRTIVLAWAVGGPAWAADVAGELGWSSGRVRTRCARILAGIRRQLEQRGSDRAASGL